MSDSGAGGAIGVIAGMGLLYWAGIGLAAMLVVATAGLVLATVVFAGVLLMAVRAWFRDLAVAARRRDHKWRRHLLMAPTSGLLAAGVFGAWARQLGNTSIQAWMDNHINGPNAHPLMEMLPLPFGILFFWLLFTLPSTLAQDGHWWLAYPGFVFYGLYLGGLGHEIAWALDTYGLPRL